MKEEKSRAYLFPLIVLVTAVPLVVKMHEYSTGLSQYAWYSAYDRAVDFFLYYKSIAIIVVAAMMLAVLVYRYFTEKEEFLWQYQLLPLGIYAGLTLLSTLFSPYKYFSIHGMTEMFESIWVLAGYCIIAFYAYEVIRTAEDVESILRWVTIGLGIMLLLGVFQASGLDFFSTKLGKMVITSRIYWDHLDAVSIVFEKGRVFMTLYNPNYVASYFGLMIPMEIALLIYHKKLIFRILYIAMLAGSVYCLLGSGNRSGIVGFFFAAVLTILMLRRQMLERWKVVLPAVAVIIVIMGVFFSQNQLILGKFARLFQSSYSEAGNDAITKIETGEADVAITYLGNTFHAAYTLDENGNMLFTLTDDVGQEVANAWDEASAQYLVSDERFPGFAVHVTELEGLGAAMDVVADGREWQFQKAEDGSYYYYNAFGRLDKINNAPDVGTKWLESKFEERGTIWSKTIPLLKDCILFGYGADTYAVVYPQDDYVVKTYDYVATAIDVKPHNLYLQIAVQSGIPALIAFLVFYVWYFLSSFRLYYDSEYEKPLEILGTGLMLATFTYMVIGVLNDSMVTVAPLYWFMMGLGIAVNGIIRRERAIERAIEDAI